MCDIAYAHLRSALRRKRSGVLDTRGAQPVVDLVIEMAAQMPMHWPMCVMPQHRLKANGAPTEVLSVRHICLGMVLAASPIPVGVAGEAITPQAMRLPELPVGWVA